MEFEEEKDALTVSVERTPMSEGWHIQTKWNPACVRYIGSILVLNVGGLLI